MGTTLQRKSWTVDDFGRMVAAGVLAEDDHVELLEGEIIEMAPVGSRHAATVNALARLFHQQVGDRCVVSVQNPIRLSERSEPQPDVALLEWRDDLYRMQLPVPADVLLVIEVADTSVATDREVKVPGYGRAGIPEAWLVDLVADVVEVHTEPAPGGYGDAVLYRPDQVIFSAVVAGIAVPVASII
ncbi:MAG: Uma2 family endonuclease [Actinomycetota bacterium]|nr:Uma2 family endonuclease [Actinomycetota bacterium]